MGTTHGLKNGESLIIEQAHVEDAAEVVSYLNRVSAETEFLSFGANEFGVSIDEEKKTIADLDGGRFNFMLIGRVNAQIVSVVTINRGKRPRLRHAGVFGISVLQTHWGVGVGKVMCSEMIAEARRLGLTKIDLSVSQDNPKAIRLYEGLGFVREGVIVRGMKIGDRYVSSVLMGLCL